MGKQSNHTSNNKKSAHGAKGVVSKPNGLSELQQRFAKKLEGGRFRAINEKLYTCQGSESFVEFQSDPNLFEVYHIGFREQATQWPINPVDNIISWIKSKHSKAIIVDMGCGDAKIAHSVTNVVHSYDLVSVNSHVVACDIAHTPMTDNTADIVVFCLSLMGTNIGDFLVEANRILKPGGIVKIVEVRSRFNDDTSEAGGPAPTRPGKPSKNAQSQDKKNINSNNNSNNNTNSGVEKFLEVIQDCGFDVQKQPGLCNNKMFFELQAKKSNRSPTLDSSYSAKACLYKRR